MSSDRARQLATVMYARALRSAMSDLPEDVSLFMESDFRKLPEWIAPQILNAVRASPKFAEVQGKNGRERNDKRDVLLMGIFGRDVLSHVKDEEENALRAMLVLIFEAIQSFDDFYPALKAFNDGLRSRILRYILLKDEDFKGLVHAATIRHFITEEKNAAKISRQMLEEGFNLVFTGSS